MYIFILIALFITIILYFTVVDNSIFYFAANKKKNPVKTIQSKQAKPVKIIQSKKTQPVKIIDSKQAKPVKIIDSKKTLPVKIIDSKQTKPVKKKPSAPIYTIPKKPQVPPVIPQNKSRIVQRPPIIKGVVKSQPAPLVHNIITSYTSRDDNALKTNVNTFKNQYSVFKVTQLTPCNTNNPTVDDIICNLKFQYKLQSFI